MTDERGRSDPIMSDDEIKEMLDQDRGGEVVALKGVVDPPRQDRPGGGFGTAVTSVTDGLKTVTDELAALRAYRLATNDRIRDLVVQEKKLQRMARIANEEERADG